MTAPPAGALPPLPEPDFLSGNCNIGESAYTAEQMREYALLAALRLREWRPIESAPKDGTHVLLWIKWSDEPVVGKFSHGRWWAGIEHHEVNCGAYCYGGSVSSEKDMKPILWRPIESPTADDLARVLEEGE